MKVKKMMAMGLAVVMTAAMLTGCGGGGEDASSSSNAKDQTNTKAAESSSEEEVETASAESKQGGEKVMITFSLWDEIQSVVYQELIDKFEEQNPDIDVEMQLTPWDQYWTKFDAAAGADQAADTFFMNGMVQKYAEAGILEPLDSYMERDNFDFSLYSPSIVEVGTYNGVHYTVPKGSDSLAVILNVALFEKYGVTTPESGWTWDDMVNISKELKEKIDAAGDNIKPLDLMLNSGNGSWQPILYSFGGSIYKEDGTSGFGEPESIEAISALVDLIEEGLIFDYQTISDSSAEELFISDQACMLYLPSFSAQKIEQAGMENVKLIQVPKAKTQDFLAGNMHYGMNSQSQHKEEAWRFLQYLASEEANDIIGKSGIDLPARISSQQYYGGSYTQFDGSAFAEDLAYAQRYPLAPSDVSDAISTIQSEGIISIFTGQVGVEEGMLKMKEDIDAELAKSTLQ